MELSEKLQELRKEKGLTQEELAEALFVSRTARKGWLYYDGQFSKRSSGAYS